MQIIDFERKGNIVRFYLGEKTKDWGWTKSDYKQNINGKLQTPDWLKPSDIYYGDDWDDKPYEQNAGKVYDEFIKGYVDIAFNFDSLVLEPSQSFENSYRKDDMVARIIPCIIVVPEELITELYSVNFDYWLQCDKVKKYYFGDEINDKIIYV